MDEKDFCCYCGEETGYKEGYMIWKTFDEKWGHKYCVEKYDKQNKTEKIKKEEEIEKLEGKIQHFEYEKQKCQVEIEKLKKELSEMAD